MTPQTRILVVISNFLVAVSIGIWSLYLVSMPLHPRTGDSHGGLLAVFSGMFLLPVAMVAFAAGRLFQRHSRAAWPVQLVALALVAALALILSLGSGVA